MAISIQTSQNVDLEYEIAGVGDRILAQLIDYIIYFGWILAWAMFSTAFRGSSGGSGVYMYIVGLVMPMMFYPLLCEYFLDGQTLGKRGMDIRVVRLDGTKPTLGAYILRWLLIIIDVYIVWGLVSILTIVINGKGQRVGDIAAGTTVVKLKKRVSLSQVIYKETPQNYEVTFDEVTQLNDNDIETIRQVLRKSNSELWYLTADKIKKVLDIKGGYIDPKQFLQTIVNDYAHLANKTED